MKYAINFNEDFNSYEITFDGKPSAQIREILKAQRFRWHSVKKLWYGYTKDIEALKASIEGGESEAPTRTRTETAVKVNKFGVKVGDLFYSSWGYEQTNVDFFQVIALVGESSIRVRHVVPPMTDEKAVSGMSADRTYKTKGLPILPPVDSVFITDNEHGDMKRLKSYAADGKSNPQFNLTGYASAYYCSEDQITKYESWYY